MSMILEAINAFIDQQFTGDINILPDYSLSQIAMILKVVNEEEMIALIEAGERATWPNIPAIDTTTRIGRTRDKILHEFEIDAAHWLQTAPQTDPAIRESRKRAASA